MPPSKSYMNGASSCQSLREHLLAQVQTSGPPHPQQQQQQQQRTHALDGVRGGSPDSPHHSHNIDPAIAGSGGMMSNSAGESGGDDNGSDGKKGGKRELSTSKRAAQNRAAQRAFRQRKEGHIKKLEEQVRDYNLLSENFKSLQAENYQLRDYIINLQSRLLESQGEFPQPPGNIDLHHPPVGRSNDQLHQQQVQQQPPPPLPHHHHVPAPTAPMGSSAISQLQVSQVVQDLRNVGPQQQRPGPYDPRSAMDVKMQNAADAQLSGAVGSGVTAASV
ncbi:hypothetical protein MMC14_002976 [Varicellaria rhodocarpa]|nr:hypothetical protein [Varicellaria rhodocarpa]